MGNDFREEYNIMSKVPLRANRPVSNHLYNSQ
jgi:hypothetical protein